MRLTYITRALITSSSLLTLAANIKGVTVRPGWLDMCEFIGKTWGKKMLIVDYIEHIRRIKKTSFHDPSWSWTSPATRSLPVQAVEPHAFKNCNKNLLVLMLGKCIQGVDLFSGAFLTLFCIEKDCCRLTRTTLSKKTLEQCALDGCTDPAPLSHQLSCWPAVTAYSVYFLRDQGARANSVADYLHVNS